MRKIEYINHIQIKGHYTEVNIPPYPLPSRKYLEFLIALYKNYVGAHPSSERGSSSTLLKHSDMLPPSS